MRVSVVDRTTREGGPFRGFVPWSLALGGLLYVPFGLTEFVRPWGSPVRYDSERAYDVVVDRSLYWWSAAPGSLALALTAAGTVLLLRRAPRSRACSWALGLAAAACLLGVVSCAGVAASFDPVGTGMRMLGFLAIGSATTFAARALPVEVAPARLVGAVAALGLFLVPLWPLVYAVEVVPAPLAAGWFALYGVVWASLAAVARPTRSPSRAPGAGAPAALA